MWTDGGDVPSVSPLRAFCAGKRAARARIIIRPPHSSVPQNEVTLLHQEQLGKISPSFTPQYLPV